jgi:hypothetical protein
VIKTEESINTFSFPTLPTLHSEESVKVKFSVQQAQLSPKNYSKKVSASLCSINKKISLISKKEIPLRKKTEPTIHHKTNFLKLNSYKSAFKKIYNTNIDQQIKQTKKKKDEFNLETYQLELVKAASGNISPRSYQKLLINLNYIKDLNDNVKPDTPINWIIIENDIKNYQEKKPKLYNCQEESITINIKPKMAARIMRNKRQPNILLPPFIYESLKELYG